MRQPRIVLKTIPSTLPCTQETPIGPHTMNDVARLAGVAPSTVLPRPQQEPSHLCGHHGARSVRGRNPEVPPQRTRPSPGHRQKRSVRPCHLRNRKPLFRGDHPRLPVRRLGARLRCASAQHRVQPEAQGRRRAQAHRKRRARRRHHYLVDRGRHHSRAHPRRNRHRLL